MIRLGVIDVGSNSVRLLVAGVTWDGEVHPLTTDLITTRLGEGIGSGMLLPGAMARTVQAIGEFRATIERWAVDRVVVAATSAVRDAGNRNDFLEAVEKGTGYRVKVLSGKEEAFFSYYGVIRGLKNFPEGAAVIDVGGGSTEFTWQEKRQLACCSTRVGAVRMTEGGHSDDQIRKILHPAVKRIKESRPALLVGVGGTITTCAAMDLKMERYDPARVHGHRIELSGVESLLKYLILAGPGGRKKVPGLQPVRADIIVAGLRIVLLIMRELEIDCLTVSEADILYGLASMTVSSVETKNVIDYQ